MKLWLVEGPWYTAVVRAPNEQRALAQSASGRDGVEFVGWADLGHSREDVTARELEPDGPIDVLVEHTG